MYDDMIVKDQSYWVIFFVAHISGSIQGSNGGSSTPGVLRDAKKLLKEWKNHCYSKAWADRPSMPFLSQLWTRNGLKKHGLRMIAVLRDCGKAEQVTHLCLVQVCMHDLVTLLFLQVCPI